MTYTRRNVWELGSEWADPILWYARGVKAMKARTADQRLSWLFFGGMHDYDEGAWKALGLWDGHLPSKDDYATFWHQCQHGSWYFLPWHRGYLMALEAAIRHELASLPGAPADWALPYWNYFKPGQGNLPPAFGSPDWPDGKGDNPLYVKQRFGPGQDGKVYVPSDQVDEDALTDNAYIGLGAMNGGGTGFGGPRTGFINRGQRHGGIETQPHDVVHGLIGGSHGQIDGLMSSPVTAAVDPIFWLHHCNIDRLWEAWLRQSAHHANPTNAAWLKGPASQGDRPFSMPMPSGEVWTYTPADMQDLSKLDYGYDDVSTGADPHTANLRFMALGADASTASRLVRAAQSASAVQVELLGANDGMLAVRGSGVSTALTLQPEVQGRTAASLKLAHADQVPDRIFLNLENVRSQRDGIVLTAYVHLPEGADPARHPELRAGSVALFGVRAASEAEGAHGGDGVTFVLDITRIIDHLHHTAAPDTGKLGVRLVALNPVPDDADLSIGRVSVFRQGH